MDQPDGCIFYQVTKLIHSYFTFIFEIRAFVNDSISDITKEFKENIFDKLNAPKTPTGSPKAGRKSSTSKEAPNAVPDRRIPAPMPYGGQSGYDFDRDLRQPGAPPVGGRDLDPLGRGQGGMIMDPNDLFGQRGPGRNPYGPSPFGPVPGFVPGGGRLPPGAIPPGARFDPFGPPSPHGPRPNRYRGPRPPPGAGQGAPNPDHMNPPDGYEDMFM